MLFPHGDEAFYYNFRTRQHHSGSSIPAEILFAITPADTTPDIGSVEAASASEQALPREGAVARRASGAADPDPSATARASSHGGACREVAKKGVERRKVGLLRETAAMLKAGAEGHRSCVVRETAAMPEAGAEGHRSGVVRGTAAMPKAGAEGRKSCAVVGLERRQSGLARDSSTTQKVRARRPSCIPHV